MKNKKNIILILIALLCIFFALILNGCARKDNRKNEPIITATVNITPILKTPEPTKTPEVTHGTPSPTPKTGPGGDVSCNSEYYGKKIISLTFDDGPNTKVTEKLLDGLKARGIKATFFVSSIGTNTSDWENDKRILQRMADEGHEIGNHTQSHKKLTEISNEEVKNELNIVNTRVKEMTGIDLLLFRPPTGAYEKRVVEVSGMAMVHFSVDSNDWRYLSESYINSYAKKNSLSYDEARQQLVKYVLDSLNGRVYDNNIKSKGLKHGTILLMHDIYDATVDLTLALIDELSDMDYVFMTVSDQIKTEEAVPSAGKVYKYMWEGYKMPVPNEWIWG